MMDKQISNNMDVNSADWVANIEKLMTQAREANNSFEFDQALEHLTALENIWDTQGFPEFSLEMRLEVHREKGRAFAYRGKHEDAIKEYQKILTLCQDNQHLQVKAETFTQIGQLLSKQGEYDRALGYLQRAIGAYRRLKDAPGMCKALRNLGVVYVELGEFEEAEATYDEAIATADEIGDWLLYADLVNNLGTILNMKGNWQRALELYRESLEIYEIHKEKRKRAYTENNLAITLSEQGMNDEAFEYFKKAHETGTSINDAALIVIVDINLADLYLKRGQLDEAQQHCRKAHDYLTQNNQINGNLVEIKKIAGKIFRQKNQHQFALSNFNEALHLSREISARYFEAEVLMERGMLHRDMEKHLDALADLEASYHIYSSIKAEGKQEQTEQIIHSIEELYLEIFDLMAKDVDHKDAYTKGHSDRVASLSLLLARELGLRPHMLKTIVAAGLLHDVGKIKIDDSVLKKNGKLDEEEFRLIQRHPELGVELLRGKQFPWDIKPLILMHHEKLDGTGYPLGLKGDDIPLGARILSVADVFDALTSDRVYRKAFDIEKALEIMNEDSGKAFDPVVLQSFVKLVRDGKADRVINANTREKEMYSIWSQCLKRPDQPEQNEAGEAEEKDTEHEMQEKILCES